MFQSWFDSRKRSDALAVASSSQRWDWNQFVDEVETGATSFSALAGKRVAVPLASSPASIARLFALARAGVHVFLLAENQSRSRIEAWASEFRWAAAVNHDGSVWDWDLATKPSKRDQVTILTSGTTGRPKAVEHTWESLLRPVRPTPPGQSWLLTYRPHLYAGLQVVLQCLGNQGTLALPGSDASADEVASLCLDVGVRFASATPSYWRWLMALANPQRLQAIPFEQITLGGEVVDQTTLDALHRTFPRTRLVHIYATTELGRCFSVTDGQAGFPTAFLESKSVDGIEMKVDAGELVVRSANAMNQYDGSDADSPREAWFRTGDLVNVEGDRVTFVGRSSDMINVGGNKVFPIEVETIIRGVPGVADVRVYGEASSLVGQLVKCDLVIQQGFEPKSVQQDVQQKTLDALSSFQRPRFISIVDEIPRTSAGKTRRTNG